MHLMQGDSGRQFDPVIPRIPSYNSVQFGSPR
jgi:hypothetical protein